MPVRNAVRIMSLGVLVFLAACGRDEDNTHTDISISDEQGNVVAAADGKSGKVSLNLPGFSANVRLPKLDLDADNLDIDGVKLYPGSTISGVNVNAGKAGTDDKVEIRFAAPATPAKVRDYFLDAFRGKGATVAALGNGLSGKGEDGDPFRIDLSPAAGGTAGVILLSSKN